MIAMHTPQTRIFHLVLDLLCPHRTSSPSSNQIDEVGRYNQPPDIFPERTSRLGTISPLSLARPVIIQVFVVHAARVHSRGCTVAVREATSSRLSIHETNI